jgi:hypothetical protein
MTAATQLLTDTDLVDLTGYKQPRRQAEWLKRSGIRFLTRHDGRPALTWEMLNSSLVERAEETRVGPDLSWMK